MPLVSFCLSLLDDQQQPAAVFYFFSCCFWWHRVCGCGMWMQLLAFSFVRRALHQCHCHCLCTNQFIYCVCTSSFSFCLQSAIHRGIQRLRGNTNNASLVNACASRVANAYNKKICFGFLSSAIFRAIRVHPQAMGEQNRHTESW